MKSSKKSASQDKEVRRLESRIAKLEAMLQPGQVKQCGQDADPPCVWTDTVDGTLHPDQSTCNVLIGATGSVSKKLVVRGSAIFNAFGTTPITVSIGTDEQGARLAINGGLHVGSHEDPGDNNALIDGNLRVPNQPCARAYCNANYPYGTGWQVIRLNADAPPTGFDVGDNFSTATYQFTAPVTGYYQVNACIRFYNIAAGEYIGIVIKNITTGKNSYAATYTSGTKEAITISDIIKMSEGDILDLEGYCNGAASSVYGDADGNKTFMSVRLMG